MQPGIGGDEGGASPIMTRESPICTSACMTLPSGRRWRMSSVAPNACWRNSISRGTSRTTRYGVTVRYPSGIGFTPAAGPRTVAAPPACADFAAPRDVGLDADLRVDFRADLRPDFRGDERAL